MVLKKVLHTKTSLNKTICVSCYAALRTLMSESGFLTLFFSPDLESNL